MAYSNLSFDPWELPAKDRNARFVGREPLLAGILSAVADQREHDTIQHYLLLGPRGIGKTTLLLTLRDRIRETPALSAHWFCVQLREEEYFVRTLRDLLELVLGALADEAGIVEAKELFQQVRAERQEDRSLALAMDGLRTIASKYGKRILLLIDNFDRIFPDTARGPRKARPADNEYKSFRKLLSTESFLMVVGASVQLFEEIAAYDRAFFNFFCPVEVPNLTDDEICELLRRCGEAEGNTHFLKQFDAMRDKVRAITYLAGGNPRLVMMLYSVLRHDDMSPVVQALRETVGGLTPMLKQVMDDMPRQQSKTLDALARLHGAASPNQIAKVARLSLNVVTVQLGRLKEGRFVTTEGEGKGRPATYRISDPMFHTWYQMRYLRPEGRRIELFVDFIRAWFSVEERRQFLEERWSKLTGSTCREMGYEAGLTIQYYATALEDAVERDRHIGRLADWMVAGGNRRAAAMLLAESTESPRLSGKGFEAAGFKLLGDRMLQNNSLAEAEGTYLEALDKDPKNIDATLDLAFVKAHRGNPQGAIADFTVVIELLGASVEDVAIAYVNRGVVKAGLDDTQGAIADYTVAIELPGASVEDVAKAYFNRAVAKAGLNDTQRATADYTAVIELPGAPVELVANAYVNRGVVKTGLDDTQGAMADFTAVIEPPGAPGEHVGLAYFNRGLVKAGLDDTQGEIADYTAVIELPGASVEDVAKAYFNRAVAKAGLNDTQRAMADYTAVIELPGAPVEQVAKAYFNRGLAKAGLDDTQGEIADYTAVIELPGAPVEQVAKAYVNRGWAKADLDDTQGAIADYTAVIEMPMGANSQIVHFAFERLAHLYLKDRKPEEATRLIAQLHKFEPEGTALELRLEVRIRAIAAAAREFEFDAGGMLLAAAMEADPEEIRARMEFLGPALRFAETGDAKVLSGLPERERDMAKQIASSMKKTAPTTP